MTKIITAKSFRDEVIDMLEQRMKDAIDEQIMQTFSYQTLTEGFTIEVEDED